ncbi:partner of Y14 and mago-like [Glandiceps talaboti]
MAASSDPSNIVRDDSGSYIPATQRPDGSWRKARRVKDGYVPQEDVPVYESKGKQWMNSIPKLPPGYVEESKEEPKKTMSKSAKKNERRKQKKKEKKEFGSSEALGEDHADELAEMFDKTMINIPRQNQGNEPKNPSKRIKNIKKKLRQIEDLEEKIASGTITSPSKEQLDKIARKQDLEDELLMLED